MASHGGGGGGGGVNPGATTNAIDAFTSIVGAIGNSGGGGGNTFVDPNQQPFLQDIRNRASDLSRQPGALPFDPLQIQGQVEAQAQASRIPSLTNAAQSANEFLLGDVLDPASNPFLQASANAAINPIFENLNRNVLPSIRGNAALTGNVGSSRQGIAEGLAAQGALGAAGDVSTNIFSQAYGQGLNALTQGLGLAPQTAQASFLPSQILQNIGNDRRNLQTELLNDPLNQLERFQGLVGNPTLLSLQDPSAATGLTGIADSVNVPTILGGKPGDLESALVGLPDGSASRLGVDEIMKLFLEQQRLNSQQPPQLQ